MSKEEEIMNWWLAHRGCTEDAKKRYGSYDWDMIGFAMRQFAKEVAIGFLIDTTGDAHKHNAEQLYQQYLDGKETI